MDHIQHLLAILSALALLACGSPATPPQPAAEPEPSAEETKPNQSSEPVVAEVENNCIPQEIIDEVMSCPEHLIRCPDRPPPRPIREIDPAVCSYEIPTDTDLAKLSRKKQIKHLERLIERYEELRLKGSPSPHELETCASATIDAVWDHATKWHMECAGTDSKPGTKDPETGHIAIQLYRLLLDAFPEIDTVPTPQWKPKEQPTRYRIQYYIAKVHWYLEEWQECAEQFSRVVDQDPCGEYADDAAYGAYLATWRPAQGRDFARTTHPPPSSVSSRELSDSEKNWVNLLRRAICVGRLNDIDESELIHYKLQNAGLYRSAGRWWEATAIFREMAFTHFTDSVAPYAANYYFVLLDHLIFNAEPKNERCREEALSSIGGLCSQSTTQGRVLTRDYAFEDTCTVFERKLLEPAPHD